MSSADKETKFPRKKEREACWAARDTFWDCMKANKEDATKCAEARKGFEAMCPTTWVTHFDRKFEYEKFKTRLRTEGYQSTDDAFDEDPKKSS